MELKERIYSVLIVSAAEKQNSALSSLLPESHYYPVNFVSNISAAKRLWSGQSYDFVIINSPLPDDPGIRFSIDVCASKGTAVLLLTAADIREDVRDKVSVYGVFTLAKPLSRSSFFMALDWMTAMRERLRGIEKKTVSVDEKMAEIRLVNKAKWLLISELKMDEPQAHRYIEKMAMDQCVSRRSIAEEIIKTYG